MFGLRSGFYRVSEIHNFTGGRKEHGNRIKKHSGTFAGR